VTSHADGRPRPFVHIDRRRAAERGADHADVSIWAIGTIEGKRKKTYRVRWLVAGRKFGTYFDSSTLADNYRTQLKTAQNKGEPFNTEKPGLPDSTMEPIVAEPEPPELVVTWFELAATYVDKKWKRLAAKSRETTVYALAALLPGLIDDVSGPTAPSSAPALAVPLVSAARIP
jgi:hypothetical protein